MNQTIWKRKHRYFHPNYGKTSLSDDQKEYLSVGSALHTYKDKYERSQNQVAKEWPKNTDPHTKKYVGKLNWCVRWKRLYSMWSLYHPIFTDRIISNIAEIIDFKNEEKASYKILLK